MRPLHTTFGAAVLALCAVVATGAAGCGGLGPPRDAQVSPDPDGGAPVPPPAEDGGRADSPATDRPLPDLGGPGRDGAPGGLDLGGNLDRPATDAPRDMPRPPDMARPADLPAPADLPPPADAPAPPIDVPPGVDTPLPQDTTPPILPDAGGGGADAMMCVGPIPQCVPQGVAGDCDPVCQIGCACDERCRATGGSTACEPAPANPIPVGGECSTANDECRGGAICLPEFQSSCGAHCYRMCESDVDCAGGARCNLEIDAFGGPGAKACGPPPETCDPTGQASCGRPDRPSPAFGCYPLALDHADQTVCDCAGLLELDAPCTMERDCRPGLECVESGGQRTCRPLCKLAGDNRCPAGQTCMPFTGGAAPTTRHGFCR